MTPLLASVVAGFLSAQEPPREPGAPSAALESQVRGAPRCKASRLIGCEVANTKNQNLGEIQDIVLDRGGRHIAYAVVAYGGFLGMGEKLFAMPWRLLEVDLRGSDDTPHATLGLDQETLKTAPGFDGKAWPDMANPSWAAQVDDYYRARHENPRKGGAPEPKGSGAEGKRGIDRAPGSEGFVHRRLSQLIGMQVVDAHAKHLADVEDLIVDTKLATVDGVLLSFGGLLGMGEKLVLVPADSLALDRAKTAFVFPCSKPQLERMALAGGKLPALNHEEWLTDGRTRCAEAKEEHLVVDGDVIVVDAAGVQSVPFADSYDAAKAETIAGRILTIGSVWIGDDKEERVRLRVRTADGRNVIVYAAPEAYADQQELGLRPDRTISVTGSRARYGGQTVLVAGTLTVDGKTAKLRDDQGHVTWAKR